MRIKQQKQIKAFLVGEFGKDRGCSLFDRQSNMLSTLIKNTRNKSKNQMKTLIGTILPGIALYKVLSEEDLSEETVTTYMEKYMFDHVAANMHSSMKKMEIYPAFISFTARYSFVSCDTLICRKVYKAMAKITLT